MTAETGAEGWREWLDDVDAALVDGYQSGFPVVERPFERVGADLGVPAGEALRRVERLHDRGVFRRFGPVLNPPVVGASTLAAVQAPEGRFEEVVEVINGYPQVNHNYRRDHEWNVWFVVTAGSLETRERILAEVEDRTGCDVLNLPMLTEFYIDLEFPVVNADSFARESPPDATVPEVPNGAGEGRRDGPDGPDGRGISGSTSVEATHVSERATVDLSSLDRSVLLAVQGGFPLSETPYRDVAASVGEPVADVLASVRRLRETGCIKRVGCVVDHVTTGFDANCMVVWDVPDDELEARGVAAGELPYVTLCYHRPRRPEQGWPYNLFTMIHGRDADAVDGRIDELAGEYLPFEHERLYSTATLKQTGARYEEIVGRE